MIVVKKGEHWLLSEDDNGVYHLALDREGHAFNTLHSDVMQELALLLDCIESSSPKALVLSSAKQAGFMVGADLRELQSFQSEEEMHSFITFGQGVLQRLADLSCPTIALIHGACVGGGYELALACDYRVASPGALIALPEVKLGLIPAWGGCVRLMRLLGVLRAMPLLVLGRRLSTEEAFERNLIDGSADRENWPKVIGFLIRQDHKRRHSSLLSSMASRCFFRGIYYRLFKKRLKGKGFTRQESPAPYAILDNWLASGVSDKGFAQEAKAVSKLLFTPQCRDALKRFLS